MTRLRAIRNALLYGVLPSIVYERERHYACSYWEHLWMNLTLAGRWLTWCETDDDRRFEAS